MTAKPKHSDAAATIIDTEKVEDRYYLFAMLGGFANRLQVVGDTLLDEITWKQWFAMLGASVFDGVPSVSQVADFVGTSHQNVKQLLLRLQTIGMVRLEKDPQDQRRILVHLTAKSQAFKQRYERMSERFMDELFEGIPQAQLAVARQVMDRLDQNLRALAAAPRQEDDA